MAMQTPLCCRGLARRDKSRSHVCQALAEARPTLTQTQQTHTHTWVCLPPGPGPHVHVCCVRAPPFSFMGYANECRGSVSILAGDIFSLCLLPSPRVLPALLSEPSHTDGAVTNGTDQSLLCFYHGNIAPPPPDELCTRPLFDPRPQDFPHLNFSQVFTALIGGNLTSSAGVRRVNSPLVPAFISEK